MGPTKTRRVDCIAAVVLRWVLLRGATANVCALMEPELGAQPTKEMSATVLLCLGTDEALALTDLAKS